MIASKIKLKHNLPLIIILAVAALLRFYGINWDSGMHHHPDERMLIMVAERIDFFRNLNPDFFNYGSLPVYVLKGFTLLIDAVFKTAYSNYDGMLLAGRSLSAVTDLLTIVLIYRIGNLIFSGFPETKRKAAALSATLLYSLAFFPIQNAHFFVVDVFINFFATLLVYRLLILAMKPSFKKMLFTPIIFAAMMATKFTAVVFYPVVMLTVILSAFRQPGRGKIVKTVLHLFAWHLIFFIFHFIFMPYAYIEKAKFISDIAAQLRMNSNPYIFPYTLQYVGTLPYLYYLRNIFFWGLGPLISLLFLFGAASAATSFIKVFRIKKSVLPNPDPGLKYFVFILFYLLYFIVIGRSAVKFMRYFLPLYPFFTLLAGYGLYRIGEIAPRIKILIIGGTAVWTLLFVNIYSAPYTRKAATDWILENIPAGSVLAVEHWDDRIPVYGGENYLYEEMTLYELPDDNMKWQGLEEKLKKSDYMVIASNRLYVPLQKLKDCNKYQSCYPRTSEYYRKLFSGQLDFRKVAEFSSYPGLKIGKLKLAIPDDSADESFTVYDHPKILIFKKI